jgi:hypothetical protein
VTIAFLCLLVALATIRATAERAPGFSSSNVLGQALAIQAQPSPQTNFRFFSDEAEFLKAAGKVTVEGFEEFPQGTCVTGPAQGPGVEFPTANFRAVIQTYILYPGSTETVFLCAGDSGQMYDPGAGPTEGINGLVAGSETGSTYNLMIYPNSPTYAIGFDYTDVAERIGEPTGIAGDGSFAFYVGFETGVASYITPCCGGPHEGFLGFISTEPFSNVLIRTQGRNDIIGLDLMMLGVKRINKVR